MENFSLQTFAARAFETACGIAAQKEVLPVFLIYTPGKELKMLPCDFSGPQAKAIYYAAMRKLLHEFGATAYCFVTEAWTRKLSDGTFDGIAPSIANDRIETLLVDAWHKDGSHVLFMAPIVTAADGKRSVGAPDTTKHDGMMGAAINLFAPERDIFNPMGGMQ